MSYQANWDWLESSIVLVKNTLAPFPGQWNAGNIFILKLGKHVNDVFQIEYFLQQNWFHLFNFKTILP